MPGGDSVTNELTEDELFGFVDPLMSFPKRDEELKRILNVVYKEWQKQAKKLRKARKSNS